MVGGLPQVGPPEGVGPNVVERHRVAGVVPLHPRVAVAAGTAQETVVDDPELLHRRSELGDPVLAEPVLLVGGQVREVRNENLALLAQGAGHQGDTDSLGNGLGHGGPVVDRLIVGVRVNEKEAPVHGGRA